MPPDRLETRLELTPRTAPMPHRRSLCGVGSTPPRLVGQTSSVEFHSKRRPPLRGPPGCLVPALLPDEIPSSFPASFVAGLPACLKEGLSAAILAGSATHACLACPELRRRACPACPERSRREWKRGKQTRRARPERNRKELCRGERCRRDQLASLTHHPPIALDAAGQPRAWPRTDHFRDKAFREKILLRDRGRCFYCRRALGVPSIPSVAEGQDKKSYAEGSYAEGPARPLSVGDWSLDHVVPVARSGSDAISNLVACCHSCNSSKTDLPAEEFLRKLREEMLLSKSQLRSQLNALRLLARKSS